MDLRPHDRGVRAPQRPRGPAARADRRSHGRLARAFGPGPETPPWASEALKDGCLLYAVHEGEDRVTVIENWSDRASLDAHSAGPALEAIGAEIAEALTAPLDVAVLQPVPVGEPGKDRLPQT
ncbi:putative quinol monooxygenase [Streptomyces lydicus]|uniref:putative quinol monooxygenase n=1 Tax=Streptomyces lydicus TaxID=47763 RepID=UPI0037A5D4D4